MLRISRTGLLRFFTLAFAVICLFRTARADSEICKLLPASTDVVVTVNARAFLQEYRDDPSVQRYLDQWRLAAQGDQTQLLQSYESQEILRYEGISPRNYLERAAKIQAAYDAFGHDPLKDIDWITFACSTGNDGFQAIVVEGRFPLRNTDSLEKFFRQHLFPVNQGEGPSVRFLDEKTLAFTNRKKAMEALQTRVEQKLEQLPSGIQTLLQSGQKQHLSLVVGNLQSNLRRLMNFVDTELAGSVGVEQGLTKSIIGKEVDWITQNAADFAGASFGITVKNDKSRLEFGLDARRADEADELRRMIDGFSFLGMHALRAIDHELAPSLAHILSEQRTVLKETALVIHIEIPNGLIGKVLRNPSLDLFPHMSHGQQATESFPGVDEVQQAARGATSLPLWKSGADSSRFKELRDIAYKSGPGTDVLRNRLDMYLPAGKTDFPVVVLVHGGGWDQGDNRCAGLYSSVGQFLANQEIGAVLPNYRLSPQVKHPEHVQDVAKAVAWTRSHIGEYGGDARRLYLMGHSAGGHLVSLLATEESYLKAEGMSRADLKGVVTVSGVYRISEGLIPGALWCSGPRALRIEQMLPLRGEFDPFWKWQPPGVHVEVDVFGAAFGNSSDERANASPINHVDGSTPPFLIVAAEHDLPMLAPLADEFHAALQQKGGKSRLLHIPRRNHNSLLFSAISLQDPLGRAIVEFVQK